MQSADTYQRNRYGMKIPEAHSLGTYLKEISKHKTLPLEEEVYLGNRIQKGDVQAKQKLVKANLRFVVSVARNYENQGMELSDLINEGNLGLIRAASRYDPKKNFKFISYAVWWIRQGILQALAENSRIVKMPLNQVQKIHTARKAEHKLEQRLGRSPNMAEISDETGLDIETLNEVFMSDRGHVSFDTPIKDMSGERDLKFGDMLEDDSYRADASTDEISLKEEVEDSMKNLNRREKEIVKMYYGINEGGVSNTLNEIGSQINITRERVRQIKERAMEKLKLGRYSRRTRERCRIPTRY
jgi:RNA polymerase primary sigma factor